MKHTTHYLVTINDKDKIVLLTRPLSFGKAMQDLQAYTDYEDTKIKALVREDGVRGQYFFRNYTDAKRYFNYLREMYKDLEFFNCMEN